jgi:hypothetical protein
MMQRLLPMIAVFLALSACSDWNASASLASPDGRTIAQIEVALAGAPANNRTRVVIRNGTGGTLPKSVEVVEAKDAIVGFTRLRWLDRDNLQVALCDATSFNVVAENMREPAYVSAGRANGTGSPNAVWVEVVNLTYSETKRACLPHGDGS